MSSGTTSLTTWTPSLPTELPSRTSRNGVSEPIEDVPGSRSVVSDLRYHVPRSRIVVPRHEIDVPRCLDDVPDSLIQVPDVRDSVSLLRYVVPNPEILFLERRDDRNEPRDVVPGQRNAVPESTSSLVVSRYPLFVERNAFSKPRDDVPFLRGVLPGLRNRPFQPVTRLAGHWAVVHHVENDRPAPGLGVPLYRTRIEVGRLQSPMAAFVVTRYRSSTVVATGRRTIVVFACNVFGTYKSRLAEDFFFGAMWISGS
jgi:hypothetical protein